MLVESYFKNEFQDTWIENRVKKLVRILGNEWFKGKSVLDVGCGHGENGKALIAKGAQVTFTDGRIAHVDRLITQGLNAFVMDQDKPWTLTLHYKYDLIIHWGVLYHLDNWKQDLKEALARSPLICLETEIWDTNDPLFEHKMDEPEKYIHDGVCREGYDQALNHVGTIVSAIHLENYLTSLGASFVRYDDEDLDVGNVHWYSWKEGVRNGFIRGQRRFWMVRRAA